MAPFTPSASRSMHEQLGSAGAVRRPRRRAGPGLEALLAWGGGATAGCRGTHRRGDALFPRTELPEARQLSRKNASRSASRAWSTRTATSRTRPSTRIATRCSNVRGRPASSESWSRLRPRLFRAPRWSWPRRTRTSLQRRSASIHTTPPRMREAGWAELESIAAAAEVGGGGGDRPGLLPQPLAAGRPARGVRTPARRWQRSACTSRCSCTTGTRTTRSPNACSRGTDPGSGGRTGCCTRSPATRAWPAADRRPASWSRSPCRCAFRSAEGPARRRAWRCRRAASWWRPMPRGWRRVAQGAATSRQPRCACRPSCRVCASPRRSGRAVEQVREAYERLVARPRPHEDAPAASAISGRRANGGTACRGHHAVATRPPRPRRPLACWRSTGHGTCVLSRAGTLDDRRHGEPAERQDAHRDGRPGWRDGWRIAIIGLLIWLVVFEGGARCDSPAPA